jgi:hypothetical protein
LISHCLASKPRPESSSSSPASNFLKINKNSRNEMCPSLSSSTSWKKVENYEITFKTLACILCKISFLLIFELIWKNLWPR